MIQTSKKAELFDKALVDLWQAEQVMFYRPDATIYHCAQCIEKMLKGALKCYDIGYDYDHDLEKLYKNLKDSEKVILNNVSSKSISSISLWGNSIRYKNMSNDPELQDGIQIFDLTKGVVKELSALEKVKIYFQEAQMLNKKLIRQAEELKSKSLKESKIKNSGMNI